MSAPAPGDLEATRDLPPPMVRRQFGPGRAVGPYVIVRELGRGGMGAVFVAHHAALGRDVALKVVLDPTPHLHERFLREARAAARLSHPGIVAIHDVGQDGGVPYLAMELVDGEGLDRRIAREGRLAPAEAARVVAALADALEHAHAQGVLHRDVKPANVLMTRDGRPRLTDFGLAKDLGHGGALTVSGELMGTPGYMAPEQADGRAKHADARADVYGLGATLYAALTGRPPFEGGSALQLITQVCRDRPRPPSEHAAGVPAALDALCLRSLEKEPADRLASAGELGRELERFLRGEAPSVRPRHGPWVALVAVLMAALLAAVVVLSVLLASDAAPVAPAPAPAPVPIEPEAAPAAPARVEQETEEALDAWTWIELTPERSPPGRFGAEKACVHDPRRGAVVVVGGWGELYDSPLNDVWSWDGTAWTIEGATEVHRYVHGVAWDDARSRLVLFGGSEANKRPRDDLWTWAGGAWERPPIEGPRPGARQWHAMVYAPDRRTVLLFGGKGANDEELDDLWEWDGERWRLASQGAPHPPARAAPGMIYDTRRRVLVMYGGSALGAYQDDLWEWDGQVWRQRAGGPGPRMPAGMVFDGRRTLLFGGSAPSGRIWRPLDDTWSWDGETWRELAPPSRPTPRARAAMAWDPARRVVVLFGGARRGETLGDTWELRPTRR